MSERQIKIASGIFLACVIIYLLSKTKNPPASVKAITDSVTQALTPVIDGVKGAINAGAGAAAGATA